MKIIDVYTDGSCVISTKQGGYGIVIQNGDKNIKLRSYRTNTTINQMELLAVIMALEELKRLYGRCKVRVFSDSAYVINPAKLGWIENWATNNWMRENDKKLKNDSLWKRFYPLYLYHNVEFYWINKKSNIKEHRTAHDMANAMARKELK